MRTETMTYYYANDGSRFTSEFSCKQYEANYDAHLDTAFPELYVKELEGTTPFAFKFRAHNMTRSGNYLRYQWFKFENHDKYMKVCNYLKEHKAASRLYDKLHEPTSYPALLSIELTAPARMLPTENNYVYSGCYSYLCFDIEFLLSEEMEYVEKYKELMKDFVGKE